MWTHAIRIGEAVQIGEAAVVKVNDKGGRFVRLSIATSLPISILSDGIIPARFVPGLGAIAEAARPLAPA